MYKIPFHKPNIELNEEDYKTFKEIVDSGWVVNSKYTRLLEEYFIGRFNVKHAIACANCTTGLMIAVSLTKTWEMISLPVFTWESTYLACKFYEHDEDILEINLEDINKETWLMDISNISESMNIIIVDTFGNQAPKLNNEYVIYDSAHGYGLPNLGKRGLVEVVSFAQTKLVTGCQGGMILTNNAELASEIREKVTLISKMTEFSAYITLKMCIDDEMYDSINLLNNKLINIYKNEIKVHYLEQKIPEATNHSIFALLFEPKKRNRIVKSFIKNNVEPKTYYKPLVKGFTNADWVYERIIALPMYKEVEIHIPFICKLINEA